MTTRNTRTAQTSPATGPPTPGPRPDPVREPAGHGQETWLYDTVPVPTPARVETRGLNGARQSPVPA